MGADTPSVGLEELLEHSAWLTALARRLVVDSGVAEDLVQEAWVTALERPPTDRGNLRGWLAAVVRNAARGRARRAARDPARMLGSDRMEPARMADPARTLGGAEARPSAPGETPDELAASLETQRALAAEVLALAEPYRSTVILRYWHGLDAGAIARREGLAAGTVRWRLKQGLDRLRSRLDDAHGGERRTWCLALLPIARRPLPAPVAAASAAGTGPLLVALAKGLLGMQLLTKLALSVALAALAWLTFGRADETELDGRRAAPVASAPSEALAIDGRGPKKAADGVRAAAVAPAAALRAAVPPSAEVEHGLGEEWLAQRIELRVVDGEGAPVPEAWVHAGEVLEEQLGPDGRLSLTLRVHRRAPRLDFEVRAPGFASERVEAAPKAGEVLHLGELVLGPGGDLVGRVVDERGGPVDGAWVEAGAGRFPDSGVEEERLVRYARQVRSVRSQGDGRFHLTGIPTGALRVWAGREGWMAGVTEQLELGQGETVEGLEIVLAPYPAEQVIAGRVVDGEGSGVPSSIRLETRGLFGSSSQQTHTDDEGRFAILCTHPKRQSSLTAAPFSSEFGPVKIDGLRAGASGLVIEVATARQVSIEVHGRSGRVANPELELRGAGGGQLAMAGGRFGGHGLEDGVFSLRAPAEPFTVSASAPGHERRTFGPFAPDAFPERIVCELAPQAGVRGQVLGSDGRPLAGATVRVVAEARDRVTIDGFPVRVGLSTEVEVESDGAGRFDATVREQGRFYVHVSAAGHALAELGPLAVDPSVGLELEPVQLTAGGVLEGRVGGEGELAGRVVAISRGDGRARSQRTGPGGHFRFEHLTPGPWQVELRERELHADGASGSSNGFLRPAPIPHSHVVREGETTWAALGEDTAFLLRGRLLFDDAPAQGVSVGWSRGESMLAKEGDARELDAQGRFELRVPGGGRVDVQLTRPQAFGLLVPLELVEPVTEWSYALELARLDVLGLEPEPELPTTLYLWERDGVLAVVPLVGDADGAVRGLEVPAGRGRIVSVGLEQLLVPDPTGLLSLPPLASFEAPAGKTIRVELP